MPMTTMSKDRFYANKKVRDMIFFSIFCVHVNDKPIG